MSTEQKHSSVVAEDVAAAQPFRKCATCGATLPIRNFYFFETRGLFHTSCKPCVRAKVSARAAANPEQHRARVKAWKHNNPKKRKAQDIRYRKGNPEKAAAHAAVREAVNSGHLKKPLACQICGTPTPRHRLAGHHHRGYDQPLDVIWLCDPCHKRAHTKAAP